MFQNAFQSGAFLEVFDAKGTLFLNPFAISSLYQSIERKTSFTATLSK